MHIDTASVIFGHPYHASFSNVLRNPAPSNRTQGTSRAARTRNCELTCTASKTPPHLGRVTETWPNKFVRVLGFDHLLDGKQNLSSRVHDPRPLRAWISGNCPKKRP
jgi:hypothetical protein